MPAPGFTQLVMPGVLRGAQQDKPSGHPVTVQSHGAAWHLEMPSFQQQLLLALPFMQLCFVGQLHDNAQLASLLALTLAMLAMDSTRARKLSRGFIPADTRESWRVRQAESCQVQACKST